MSIAGKVFPRPQLSGDRLERVRFQCEPKQYPIEPRMSLMRQQSSTDSILSRPAKRFELRRAAHSFINGKYGGQRGSEPRRKRRRMALSMARIQFRQFREKMKVKSIQAPVRISTPQSNATLKGF